MAIILFVDGDPVLRRLVRLALARRGHTVRTAGDLRRAVRCLQDHGFDGVFVDIWLGQASGFDLLTWIQEHQPRLASRVVFLSGDVEQSPGSRRKLRALGLPLIAKPFEIRELELHIAGWSPRPGGEGLRSRA